MIKQFKDLSEETRFQIEVNVLRRHLNTFQKIELGYSLEGILRENAKRRMSLGGIIGGLANGRETNPDDKERVASAKATLESMEDKGKVSEMISRKIGIPTSMYEKGTKIIKEADELQKNRLRNGTASLTSVYNQIRKQEIAQAIAENYTQRET